MRILWRRLWKIISLYTKKNEWNWRQICCYELYYFNDPIPGTSSCSTTLSIHSSFMKFCNCHEFLHILLFSISSSSSCLNNNNGMISVWINKFQYLTIVLSFNESIKKIVKRCCCNTLSIFYWNSRFYFILKGISQKPINFEQFLK